MGSAIGSFVAGEMNRDIAVVNNQANAKLNAESWLEQKQENALDRYFQSAESQKAFDRNVEQWQRENAYNSPIEQMKRFQEAGINPTLGLLGNSAMPAASSPQMQPAKGSNAALSSPIPMQPQAMFQPFDIASDIRSFSEAIKNVAEAHKSGAETESIQKTLDSMVRKMENDADMAEFQNWLLQAFGKQRYTAETNLLVEQAFKYTSEALLAAKQGDEVESRKLANLALKNLYDKEAGLKQKDIDHYEEMLNAKIDNLASSSEENRASAGKLRAETVTENELRRLRGDLLSAEVNVQREAKNEIVQRTENLLKEAGLIPEGADAVRVREVLVKQMDEDLKSKEFNNSFTGRYILPFINNAERSAGNIISMMIFKGKL